MPTRSPRRNARSRSRAGRTFYATASAGVSAPNTLGGGTLVDWYKADAITGVTNGASIPAASIVDSSGNAHGFNAVSGTNPTLNIGGGPNGHNFVSHISGFGGYTGAAATPTPTGDVTLFGYIIVADSGQQTLMSGNDGAVSLRVNGLVLDLLRDNQALLATSTIAFTASTWQPFYVAYTKATGSTKFRIGSNSETIAGVSGSTFASTPTRAIGQRDNTLKQYFGGAWLELGRYSSVLSGTDETALWAYLNS